MLNFRWFFERWIGHSFNVSRDRDKLINLRDNEFVRYVVFFKRSWFYWLFRVWIPLLSLGVLAINIWLLWINLPSTLAFVAIWLVSMSVLLSVYTFINYIIQYKRIYKNQFIIENINKVIKKVEIWDAAFTKFFNQWWFNKILFLIFIVALIIYMFVISKFENGLISMANIGAFIVQYILINESIKTLQNLEMDFWIGTRKLDDSDKKVKWVFIHIDQEWFKLETDKDYFADQIKTIEAEFPRYIWILFNFWKLIIDTEWAGSSSQLMISNLKNPVELKDSLKKIIKESIKTYERDNNFYIEHIIINEGLRPKHILEFDEHNIPVWIKEQHLPHIRDLVQNKYNKFLKYQYQKNTLDEYVHDHIQQIYKWIT